MQQKLLQKRFEAKALKGFCFKTSFGFKVLASMRFCCIAVSQNFKRIEYGHLVTMTPERA